MRHVKGALVAAVVAGAGLAAPARAVIVYSGGLYTQNFDTLANTGTANAWANDTTLPGWFAQQTSAAGTAAVRDNSVNTVATYRADNGGSTTGAIYSYGTTGSGERAFGSLSSGTPGDFIYALILQNGGPDPLTSFTLAYDGEQWRNGGPTGGVTQKLVLDYAVFAAAPTAADLAASNTTGYTAPGGNWDFTSPVASTTAAAVDGNAAGLVAGRGGTAAVSWPVGSYLVIRWWDDNDASNDHGLALDNVTMSAVPTPGAGVLLALGSIAFFRRRR